MEVIITKDNFEKEVINSDIPALVDFWASWCGPCKMLAPVIEELAKDYEGRVKVCKVNVDEESELAIKYSIVSIPTVLLFKGGEIVDKSLGFKPKTHFDAMLG